MPEYISREAAKEALYKTAEEYDEYDKCDRIAIIALNNADEILNDIPAADVVERPRWIPVTERLPLQGQYVLVSYMSISGAMQAVSYWFSDDRNKARWGGENELFVTHWMPLPEPPEEE